MKHYFKKLLALTAMVLLNFPVFSQDYNYYFGNIHAHSSYSDGSKDGAQTNVKTPAECYAFAKGAQHFDFLGISEHNHSQAGMKLANYSKGLAQATAVNEDGRFVSMYGMEYGVIKNGGHILIYGFNQLIGWEPGNNQIFSAKSDYESLFKIIATGSNQAFATLAHPASTDYGNLISKPYDNTADQAITGVAVSSGPAFSTKTDYSDRVPLKHYSYYKKLLALGYIVGPTMDHDNHNTTFGKMSASRTVVLSTVLNRDSLINAYRANRFYASEDWDAKVDFKINNQVLGSYLKNIPQLSITAAVSDPDPGDEVKSIKLMYGKPGKGESAEVLKTVVDQNQLSASLTLQKGDAYYFFLEITQRDGDKIITSPIWAKN